MASMKSIKTIAEMKQKVKELKKAGKTISFVPTMGALHSGHLSIIEKAKELSDVVIMSSFVNPKQFNDKEDLEKYPRDLEKDRKLARKADVDLFFHPDETEIYPHGFLTTVNVSYLSKEFEGKYRPGHFRGVCTVVLKLLNIVQPDFLLLGLKDAQQYTILVHLVDDLALDVKVVGVPTIRDKDGLALSSRNVLLSAAEREKALCIPRALKRVHFLVKKQGILHRGELLQAVRSTLETAGVEVQYADIVNRTTFQPLDHVVRGDTFVIIAVKIGDVRLIDNTRI